MVSFVLLRHVLSRDTQTVIRKLGKHLLLAAILTVYGVVTVSGPGLHALPGQGHGPIRLASDHGTLPVHGDQDAAAAHDCSICHFHAQGQIATDPHFALCVDVLGIIPANDPPLLLSLSIARPSIPRAPPLS